MPDLGQGAGQLQAGRASPCTRWCWSTGQGLAGQHVCGGHWATVPDACAPSPSSLARACRAVQSWSRAWDQLCTLCFSLRTLDVSPLPETWLQLRVSLFQLSILSLAQPLGLPTPSPTIQRWSGCASLISSPTQWFLSCSRQDRVTCLPPSTVWISGMWGLRKALQGRRVKGNEHAAIPRDVSPVCRTLHVLGQTSEQPCAMVHNTPTACLADAFPVLAAC